ncbi:MAG: hypothetical protein AAF823_04140 [Planctomycetota bacterium]
MAVISPASSVTGGRWVVTGGVRTDLSGATEVQVFDFAAQRWALGEALGVGRFGHAQATLADGRVLVVGGRAIEAEARLVALDAVELIEVDGDGVAAGGTLPVAMGEPTLTVLGDGRAVAIAGESACVFDPETNAWVETIGLREGRRAHAAVVVGGAEVLVVGGGRASFEVVDVDAGVSRLLGAGLGFAIDDAAVGVGADGVVWIVGGQRTRTGRTVDRLWRLELDGDGGAALTEIESGLGVDGGVADHRLVGVSGGFVAVGGETQTADGDVELDVAFAVSARDGGVRRLASTAVAHDDATAVAHGGFVYVAGGGAPGKMFGVRLPVMPVSVAERLGVAGLFE